MAKQDVGGVDAFFAALNALTYREMNEVADLIALQLEGKDAPTGAVVAESLADAAESHFAAEDEG